MKTIRLSIIAGVSLLGVGAIASTSLVDHVQPVKACCQGETMGQQPNANGVYRDTTGREYTYTKPGQALQPTINTDVNLYTPNAPGLDGMDVQSGVDQNGMPWFSAQQKDPNRR
jgi:hypothetical protein